LGLYSGVSTALLGMGDASAASASRAPSCDVTLAWLGDGERLRPLMALGVALLDLDLDEDDFAGVAVAAGERVVAREERPREVGERPREVAGDELREVVVGALDRDRDVARDVAVGDREAAVEELRELRSLTLSLRRDDRPREVIDREVVDRPRERDVLPPEPDREEPPLFDRPTELCTRDVLLEVARDLDADADVREREGDDARPERWPNNPFSLCFSSSLPFPPT